MAHVTIPDEDGYVQSTASAGQTEFAFDFVAWVKDDLSVYQNGALLDPADWTVAFNPGTEGGYDGGTITLNTGATLSDAMDIVREIEASRSSDFDASNLRYDALNTELDQLIVRDKDIRRDVDRTFAFPLGDLTKQVLPDATTRIAGGTGSVLFFNGTTGAPGVKPYQTLIGDAADLISAEAVQDVTDEGVTQVAAVAAQGATSVAAVAAQGTTSVAAVSAQQTTSVAAVTAQGDTEIARVTAEGDTQDARVEAEGSAQVTAVNLAGSTQATAVAAAAAAQFEPDTATGLTNTSPDDYFVVVTNDYTQHDENFTPYQVFSLYQNNANTTADFVSSFYSKTALDDFLAVVSGGVEGGVLYWDGRLITGAVLGKDNFVRSWTDYEQPDELYPDGPVLGGVAYDGEQLIVGATLGEGGFIHTRTPWTPPGAVPPGVYDWGPVAVEVAQSSYEIAEGGVMDAENRWLEFWGDAGLRYRVGRSGALENVSPVQNMALFTYEIDGYQELIEDSIWDSNRKPVWLRSVDGREWEANGARVLTKKRVDLPIAAATHERGFPRTLTYTALTNGNPAQMTVNAHGRRTGEMYEFSTDETDMPELQQKTYLLEVVNANTLRLVEPKTGDYLDTSSYGSPSTGGSLKERRRYVFCPENYQEIVYLVIINGQSGAAAGDVLSSGSQAVVSTTPEYPEYVWQPVGGTDLSETGVAVPRFEPLQEEQLPAVDPTRTESICSGFGANMIRDFQDDFGGSPAGVLFLRVFDGGTPEIDMGPGDPTFERTVSHMEASVEAIRRMGKIPHVLAVIDFQGSAEANEGPNFASNTYDGLKAQKLRRKDLIEAAVRKATGQEQPPLFQFLYLRSAASPELFLWEDGHELPQHVKVLSDIADEASNIVVPTATFQYSAGDISTTYDRIHKDPMAYNGIGHACWRSTREQIFNHGTGNAPRVRTNKLFLVGDKIYLPLEGPRDAFYDVVDDNSLVMLEGPSQEAMVDTFRGVVCATKLANGNWARLPVTAVGVDADGLSAGGGFPGFPCAWIQVDLVTRPLRDSLFVSAGIRKEAGWADAIGTHDGPKGGGITPWFVRGVHIGGASSWNVDFSGDPRRDFVQPFWDIVPLPAS